MPDDKKRKAEMRTSEEQGKRMRFFVERKDVMAQLDENKKQVDKLTVKELDACMAFGRRSRPHLPCPRNQQNEASTLLARRKKCTFDAKCSPRLLCQPVSYAFASDVAGRQWEPQQPLHEFFIIFVFNCFIIYACKYFIASVIIVFHVKHRYDHDSAEKS